MIFFTKHILVHMILSGPVDVDSCVFVLFVDIRIQCLMPLIAFAIRCASVCKCFVLFCNSNFTALPYYIILLLLFCHRLMFESSTILVV